MKKDKKTEKVYTKHPLGKQGVNIDKKKYEMMKTALLSCLKNKELTHAELYKSVKKNLKNKFDGSISWYTVTVKLDLEARNFIKRYTKANKIYYKLS